MEIIDIIDVLPKHATRRWAERTEPVDCICIHHSATAPTVTAQQIARYHVLDKDMPSIQYHYVITAEGAVYRTQRDELFVWHGNDWNSGVGVCLIGDFTAVEPPEVQIAAARWLVSELRRRYGHLPVVGHGEAPRAATECPGRTWEAWKYRLEANMASVVSKLGVHYQGPPELGAESTELVRNSRIQWVKGIDPDAWPTPAREMFPGQRVLARLWIGGDHLEKEYVVQGATGADLYVARLLGRYQRLLGEGVQDFLGPNEMHPDAETIGQHAAFWLRWAQRLVEIGGRPWFGSFGVGWPNVGQIAHYADVARYCADHGGGMEVHEYGAPNVLDGDGWWTLRYRRTIAELGFEAPVFIGECGIDWGVVPGQKPTGWQSHPSWVYPEQYGLPQGVMNEERYWRQLSAYDDELCKDSYVVAATAFVTCPNNDWKTFDFHGGLIRRAAAKHATAPEPSLEQRIGEAIQRHIIPLNPNAALERAGAARGLLPASDEVRDVEGYVAQAFRRAGDEGVQHIGYCMIGDWGNIIWFERAN